MLEASGPVGANENQGARVRHITRRTGIGILAAGLAGFREGPQFAAMAQEPDAAYARFDSTTRSWTIGNQQVEAEFRLESEGYFRFLYLRNQSADRTWWAPEEQFSSPVSLTVNSIQVDASSSFTLLDHSTMQLEPAGVRLTILLAPANLTGQVRLELEVHAGQPFLRYRAYFRNEGGSAAIVTEADLLPWRFSARGRKLRGFFVGQWSWGGERANFQPHEVDFDTVAEPVEAFTGAYGNHATWGAVRDEEDHGIVFGWEFDGRARAHAEHAASSGVFVVDAQVQMLKHAVLPGEEFAVPGAFLGLFRGDWDEAGYRTQRFVEAVTAKPVPDAGKFPYVMFNSWGYQWGINETILRQAAERAAALGVEVFTVDFGWAKVTGDWQPDPAKFPNGLKPLSDYVHSLGMKFGLHMPYAEAMAESRVLREHSDWAVTPSPNQQRAYFGAKGLCLSNKPTQQWVISEILRVVRENGVDWLVQDGENMVKGCFASHHTHDPADSNYSNSVEGLSMVIAAVQREAPALLWENCEDGGNMQTFNMVRNYVTSIINDNSDFLVTRRSIYGATYPLPPRYTDRYMETTPWDTYRTRSHFFGGPLILMDKITEWPDWMAEFMRKEIGVYKSVRTLIRDGKVYHLTPPPDGTFNDYIQSCDVSTGRSVIFVYRQEAPSDLDLVRPRGLRPEAAYRVRFQDDPRVIVALGRELMESGIEVRLPQEWRAEVVYIDPESGR